MSITHEYELRYFNFTAIAEPIRFIMQYSCASWLDTRLDANSWPTLKQDYKWGQVPELIISGQQTLTQSRAIGRYLAKKFDLIPTDDLNAARCDEIVDVLLDLHPQFKEYVHAKYFSLPGDPVELKQKILTGALPVFLKNLNDFINSTHLKEPYKVGDFIFGETITWADFWLAHYTFYWSNLLDESDFLQEYGALKKQQDAVFGLERIQKYITNRPKTLF